MLRQSRGRWALLAALLFLVQSFGAAYALGARSVPIALDAFGNPLCITSHQHQAPTGDGHGGTLTDCCALACAASTGAIAAPVDAARIASPDARLLARLTGAVSAVWRPAAERMAGDPRAPPPSMGTIGRPSHQSH